tara:strand:+ start:149 stop:316 length:168 start_codon:yes stop_codon:yes gene_type:complete
MRQIFSGQLAAVRTSANAYAAHGRRGGMGSVTGREAFARSAQLSVASGFLRFGSA